MVSTYPCTDGGGNVNNRCSNRFGNNKNNTNKIKNIEVKDYRKIISCIFCTCKRYTFFVININLFFITFILNKFIF